MVCKNLGKHDAHYRGVGDVYHCPIKGLCSLHKIDATGFEKVQFCGACDSYEAEQLPRQPKGNFAYFTGTNRANEGQMIQTMIQSSRRAGVGEDFFVFAPYDVPGGIWRQIPYETPWKSHMAKVDFLLRLKDEPYDYFVWLDTDNYFVRHPGDFTDLLRDNPCWILMEGDLQNSVHVDWWSMRMDGPKGGPQTGPLIEFMRGYKPSGPLWTTNGGMWIVRKEDIGEFYERTWAAFNDWVAQPRESRVNPNAPDQADEPALAIVGQTLVRDPENNTFDKCKHVWAIEWNGAWRDQGRLPDGTAWRYTDWTTQADVGLVNPAIIHCMRSKHLFSVQQPAPVVVKEPVGTKLHEILAECGINPPKDCSCRAMAAKMDQWGIDGCQANKPEILAHLANAASNATWGDWARVALKGYLSHESLLSEAIKRSIIDTTSAANQNPQSQVRG